MDLAVPFSPRSPLAVGWGRDPCQVGPKARNLLPTESGDHRISLAVQLPSYQASANGGLQLLAAIPALASPTMRRPQDFVVSVERSLTRSPGNRHQPPCLAHPHATADHKYRMHRCPARERENLCPSRCSTHQKKRYRGLPVIWRSLMRDWALLSSTSGSHQPDRRSFLFCVPVLAYLAPYSRRLLPERGAGS